MDSTHAVTGRLAEFIVGSRWQDIPPPVRREAMRSILNSSARKLYGFFAWQ